MPAGTDTPETGVEDQAKDNRLVEEAEASAGEVEWDASQTFGGVYFVSIGIDRVRESIEVRIQR